MSTNNEFEVNQKQPGAFRVKATTIIHSKEAMNLFFGRKTKDSVFIVGVNEFAKHTKSIFSAAKKDDPYADYFLLKIEESFNEAYKQLDLISNTLNIIKNNTNITLSYSSTDPVELDTKFSTVYGNLAMDLLLKADELFLLVHALRHIGKLTRVKQETFLNGSNKKKGIKQIIRKALLSQSGFIYTNINRKDFELQTALTATVFAKMEKSLKSHGDNALPECIIDKTCRGQHAPKITVDMNQIMFKQAVENQEDKDKDKDETQK